MEYSLTPRQDRRSTRHAAKVDCYLVARHGFRSVRATTLDLSEEGLRIASDVDVRVGDFVALAFCLPNGRSFIDARGKVVRIERGLRAGDQGPAIAIRFTAMDPIDRGMLRGSLASIPPPIPRRNVRVDYAASLRDTALSA